MNVNDKVRQALDLLRATGLNPHTLAEAVLSELAQDSDGRGGVDVYVLADADGDLYDFVVAPHESWED